MKLSFPFRIYLIGLVLRLIPILLTRGLGIGLDDMFQYDMLARSLASGHGFRWYAQQDLKLLEPYVNFDLSSVPGYDPRYGLLTSFRAPLYPAFLSFVYFINGLDDSRFFAARLAQAVILGAPLAPLTYIVSSKLIPGEEKTARLSGWLIALYPMLLLYPLGLATENPFFLLLLASFYFLLRSLENPKVLNVLLSGVLLALTVLTRSVILPFAGLAIMLLIYSHGRRGWLAGIVFVLIISPWGIRNSLLHGKLTGIETSMGYNLYLGYYPQGNGSFIFGPSLDLLAIMDDSLRDEIGTQKALEFIQQAPERFLPLAIDRLQFFFGLEKRTLMYFYSNNLFGFIPFPLLISLTAIFILPFPLLSISAMLGLPSMEGNSKTGLLFLLLSAYLLPHILILSEDRFHLALLPYLAILAAWFWKRGPAALALRWHHSLFGKTTVALAVLAVLFLLTGWGSELARDSDKIAALLGSNGNITYSPY